MKLSSILMLSVTLSISNVVIADAEKQQRHAQMFTQAKARILQGVVARIEILDEFKSCVGKAKARAELKSCRADKKSAMQMLKMEKKPSK